MKRAKGELRNKATQTLGACDLIVKSTYAYVDVAALDVECNVAGMESCLIDVELGEPGQSALAK